MTGPNRHVALLFALLFAVAIVKHVLIFGIGPGPLVSDAAQYWQLGGEVAAGDWLQTSSRIDYRTPLYPMAVGVVRRLFDEHALLVTVIVQHGLLLLTQLLVAWICWQVSGSRLVALAGFALAAFSLLGTWFANLVCTEPWFILSFTAAVGGMCIYHRRPSMRSALIFAALLGWATLVRPVPKLLWVPLTAVFFLHATPLVAVRRSWRELAGHVAAVAAVVFLLCAPWCLRNWYVFGEPFLARLPAVNKWQVCFQGGSAAELPVPNSPAGNRIRALVGNSLGEIENRYCYAVVGALQRRGVAPEEADQLISTVCREAIISDPVGFFWPAFKRFVNFWRCVPSGIPYYDISHDGNFGNQRTWDFGTVAESVRRVLRNTPAHLLRWNELMAFLVGLGVLQLIVRRRTRLVGISFALTFLYFAAVTSLVEVENYKYRVVLEPCMAIVLVCGWLGILDFARSTGESPEQGAEQVDTVPYGIPIPSRLPDRRAPADRPLSEPVSRGANAVSHRDRTAPLAPFGGHLEAGSTAAGGTSAPLAAHAGLAVTLLQPPGPTEPSQESPKGEVLSKAFPPEQECAGDVFPGGAG